MIWLLNFGRGKRLAYGPTHLSVKSATGFFPGVKRLGHELGHSPPSSAKVKNEWSCTSSPCICLHGVDRENTAFFLPACEAYNARYVF
jgi:hypothetical protein